MSYALSRFRDWAQAWRCRIHAARVISLFRSSNQLIAAPFTPDSPEDVLANRGVELGPKAVRLIAYRYGARARLEQQIETTPFEERVSGRRVVISTDGGRIRLRETKRGPKTKKGRRRYTGA